MKTVVQFIGLAVALLFSIGAASARTWNLNDGRSFEAEIVTATATSVTIKVPDGRTATVELTHFSQADRDYVAQHLAASATPAGKTTTPTTPPSSTPAATPSSSPASPAAKPAGIKGPYAQYITGDWAQFEGKGKLQGVLFAAPTLDPTRKYPLVIYLHGKGNKVLESKQVGFLSACAKPANYSERPCILYAPQCPDENGWEGATGVNFMKTVKDLMHSLPIDPDRVYLTGYSMGGFGTFAHLNEEPRMFAAGVAISGGVSVSAARNLRRIPLWIFHGEKDNVVSPDGSRAIAKELERLKAPVKYTEFPGEGHGIGGKVFEMPELHTWLFAQKRK
jgi:predicted peptidase